MNVIKKRAVLLLFLCAFIISIVTAVIFYMQDREQEKQFEELAKAVDQDYDNISYRDGSIAPSLPMLDSPDCVGWIKIDGTTVNYPIMQHLGDGEYYLHRDYKGDYSFYGTPFLDIRCTTESDNCIIYGHNINAHKMFGALHAYTDEDYYKEHPTIRVRLGDQTYDYQIVAVIPTNTSDKLYDFTDASNWDEYREYVELMLNEASYRTNMGEEMEVELNRALENDALEQFFRKYQFVTLSTCRTWVGRDARMLVIVARQNKKEL